MHKVNSMHFFRKVNFRLRVYDTIYFGFCTGTALKFDIPYGNNLQSVNTPISMASKCTMKSMVRVSH
jgi:hypothetical protein